MMTQLLCHLIPEFLLQNDWMRLNKENSWLPALAHTLIYQAFFWFLTVNWAVILAIALFHFLSGRLNVARLFCEHVGIGNPPPHEPYYGWWTPPPEYVQFWWTLIVGQVLQLTFNFAALTFIPAVIQVGL